MISSRRRFLQGAAVLAGLALATSVAAQSWPTRAVKIIVPVAAGTATDLTARIFAEKLAPMWGQPIVVENRPGADGLVAIGSYVAARDDHALLFSFSTAVSLNPLIHAKLPYDPLVDLTPITTTSEVLFGIAVTAGIPVTSLRDFGAHVRVNAGRLNWAAAPGLPRFVLERHRREQKLDMVYVSYTQTGTAVQDLGEGRIQAMIGSLSTLMPVLEAKKAKLIVIASTDRSNSFARCHLRCRSRLSRTGRPRRRVRLWLEGHAGRPARSHRPRYRQRRAESRDQRPPRQNRPSRAPLDAHRPHKTSRRTKGDPGPTRRSHDREQVDTAAQRFTSYPTSLIVAVRELLSNRSGKC